MTKAFMALCLCISTGFMNPATASNLITVGEVTQRGVSLSSQIQNELDRPEVQAKLQQHGISADEAKMRIAALSDMEIKNLMTQGAQAQAGGDVVISLTVVLLIIILVLLLR